MKILAILETMWGPAHHVGRQAPLHFEINPGNHSGKRLYYTVGEHELRVTNAASLISAGPDEHHKPDPERLAKALTCHPWDAILVCGSIARHTYRDALNMLGLQLEWKRSIFMPHPASRNLPNSVLDSIREELAEQTKHPVEFTLVDGKWKMQRVKNI